MATTSQSTALVTVIGAIRSEDMQKQVSTLLPPSVNRDRFTEVTIAAVQNSPEVLEADRDSLYRACLAAARRGLLPDKREGALVVYNTNIGTREKPQWIRLVQFMPMVEGILREMTKAGIKAYATCVYALDAISLWNDDDGQHVRHEPVMFGDRGELVGVFAAARTQDGRPYVEAMSVADVHKIAARSRQCSTDKAGNVQMGGTWKSDFERMAQKSALHRLRKRLPITDEDALRNLQDMEEASDIDLTGGSAQQQTTPVDTTANVGPESPPPAQAALPAPEQANAADKGLRTPRKARVLETVKAAARVAPPPAQAQAQAPTEYSEDDII